MRRISPEAAGMGRPLYGKFGFVQTRGEMELPGQRTAPDAVRA